ncbi:MAG: Gmad2 immunoglobulin-like domain-containing protein [Peptococcaceae bacterium]|nr:Gmad2 immunoglobulin-like domain-containing protein [Peptococcaceae bacterium]
MRRVIAVLLAVALAAALVSCRAARKPELPQNKTIIVPEVSRVAYDVLDLKDAPKVVRDIAKTVEDRDAATWAQSGGKAYLIISQGDRTRNYDLEVDEILQRLPEQGFTWLDVKLAYSKRKDPRAAGGPVITVVRADVNTAPNGAGFTITGLEVTGGTAGGGRPPAAPAPPSAQIVPAGAVIEEPAPNQEISSPARVRGTARAQGQLRVRISTRGGQIIKEENLNPAPGTGSFSMEIKYSPPEMAVPGEISVIAAGGGDERVLARVPVIIK